MNDKLSIRDREGDDMGLRRRLDEALILSRTVDQLRKDLRDEHIPIPATGDGAFEELRGHVLAIVAERERVGPHALGLVINRVDLTERATAEALANGGSNGLAARIVLRCLQKVLSRHRFAELRSDGEGNS